MQKFASCMAAALRWAVEKLMVSKKGRLDVSLWLLMRIEKEDLLAKEACEAAKGYSR